MVEVILVRFKCVKLTHNTMAFVYLADIYIRVKVSLAFASIRNVAGSLVAIFISSLDHYGWSLRHWYRPCVGPF